MPSNQIIKNLKKVFGKRSNIHTAQGELRVLADLDLVKPKITKEQEAVKEFNEKYPLIKRLANCTSLRRGDQDLSDVINYVKNW